MDAKAEIDRLSSRRSELWAGAEEATPGEIAAITGRLVDLYETRRAERARALSGQKRAEIIRRARIESELERLITREN